MLSPFLSFFFFPSSTVRSTLNSNTAASTKINCIQEILFRYGSRFDLGLWYLKKNSVPAVSWLHNENTHVHLA